MQPSYARMTVDYRIPFADFGLDLDERQLAGRRHLRLNDRFEGAQLTLAAARFMQLRIVQAPRCAPRK